MKDNPSMPKLERILVCTQWEQANPTATAKVVKRPTSNHIPICLSTNVDDQVRRRKKFCFKKMWLRNEEVLDIIKENWTLPTCINDAVGYLVRKVRRLQKFLKNWEKRSFGNIIARKKELIQKVDDLERKQEGNKLIQEEMVIVRNNTTELT